MMCNYTLSQRWRILEGDPMSERNIAFRIIIGALFVLLAGWTGAYGQEYTPRLGLKGKDVTWFPTPDGLVEKMLDMANLTPDDFLMDLGSGDGRIVIAAAKRGVRSMGVEYNPDLVELSKREAEKAGVSDKAAFVQGDIFTFDFSKATVIMLYLEARMNMKLRPQLLEMKPGTRVVSHNCDMEDWKPDQSFTYKVRQPSFEYRPQSSLSTSAGMESMANTPVEAYYEHYAFLWIVPAKVAGVWTWAGQELTLSQKFQEIKGSITVKGKKEPIRYGGMKGDLIWFEVGKGANVLAYAGRVTGNTIEGVSRVGSGPATKWIASRRPPQ
jgi:methylase of polypeptide subunit release factors